MIVAPRPKPPAVPCGACRAFFICFEPKIHAVEQRGMSFRVCPREVVVNSLARGS